MIAVRSGGERGLGFSRVLMSLLVAGRWYVVRLHSTVALAVKVRGIDACNDSEIHSPILKKKEEGRRERKHDDDDMI